MSSRKALAPIGAVLVLGIGAFSAFRLGWFERDAENSREIASLGGKKLDQAPPAEAATGWFQWRGPTRDGRASAGAFRTDWDKNAPKRLWRTECGGGYGSCTVVGGKLYFQDRQGGNERIVCLNAEDGKQLWEHVYPADYTGTDTSYAIGPRATPTVLGNRLFAVGGAGRIHCLTLPENATDAPTVRWSHDMLAMFGGSMPRWGIACSPLVLADDGLVIVQPGGKEGTVVAFDPDGNVKWKAGSGAGGYSSPVMASIGGQKTVFAFTGDALLAIRLSDGKITDSYPWKTDHHGNIATPLVVDEYVFISSAYKMGCALLRAEKRGDDIRLLRVYERRGRAFQNHHSTSVYKDRVLYGFDESQLKCVMFDTGKAKEDWEAEGVAKGSLILADKHLIIQSETGDLSLVEATPDEFRLVAKMKKVLSGKNNWATPTLVDGRLYLRDETQVLCFDVRP